MPGVDPEVAMHRLHVESMFVPIKKRKQTFSDKNMAIRTEVEALLKARAIRELQFPEWIANVVLVKKSNNKWWMCIHFTSLNKACPKDFYPLPCLRILVDGSAGHEVFEFMDASRGCHQIRMLPEDEKKIAFFTEYDLFCWKVMPFGLKNVGATYQRVVNTIFKDQIGRNMKIYVDDMLVKRKERGHHLENLKETFEQLRAYKLRINPENAHSESPWGTSWGTLSAKGASNQTLTR
ncbi:hypothetical protein LIER_39805 [Lithospermum erythrorhizon]|uniref:Reverse transcriptase domain-containing protein n=1 Tax=Lithospermum erythrorhizon TaxID=34254 RepID=A0AAV3QNE3_LITER